MTPQQFLEAYTAAISSQQWENVEPLIHDNCVATFTNGTHVGKVAVEAIFRKNFALIQDEVYEMSNVHWIVETEQFATFAFHFSWSGVINGKPASGGGRGSSTIVRVGDGWQLVSEHLSPHV